MRLGEMAQLDRRNRIPRHLARGDQPPVTRDDLLLLIDQQRNVESKRLDTLSNLADLLVSVYSWVAWIRFQSCRSEICDL